MDSWLEMTLMLIPFFVHWNQNQFMLPVFPTNNKALDSTASYVELLWVVFAILHTLNMFINSPCRLEKLIINHLRNTPNRITVISSAERWGQSYTGSHHAAGMPPNMISIRNKKRLRCRLNTCYSFNKVNLQEPKISYVGKRNNMIFKSVFGWDM